MLNWQTENKKMTGALVFARIFFFSQRNRIVNSEMWGVPLTRSHVYCIMNALSQRCMVLNGSGGAHKRIAPFPLFASFVWKMRCKWVTAYSCLTWLKLKLIGALPTLRPILAKSSKVKSKRGNCADNAPVWWLCTNKPLTYHIIGAKSPQRDQARKLLHCSAHKL